MEVERDRFDVGSRDCHRRLFKQELFTADTQQELELDIDLVSANVLELQGHIARRRGEHGVRPSRLSVLKWEFGALSVMRDA